MPQSNIFRFHNYILILISVKRVIHKLVVKRLTEKTLHLLHFPGCSNPCMGAVLTLEQQMCDSRLSELSVSSLFHSHSASHSILFMTWPSEDSLG